MTIVNASSHTPPISSHVDELNSVVGIAREHCLTLKGCEATRDRVVLLLDDIQSRLMDVGAAVATPLSQADDAQKARTKFDGSNVSARLLVQGNFLQ